MTTVEDMHEENAFNTALFILHLITFVEMTGQNSASLVDELHVLCQEHNVLIEMVAAEYMRLTKGVWVNILYETTDDGTTLPPRIDVHYREDD